MSKKEKIQLARMFRKEPTHSEKLIWEALRNRNFLNLKFRRQYVMEGYVLDYYCPELHLAVEIDGTVHNDQSDEDNRRQTVLEQSGVLFFRVKSEDVEKHLDSILKELSQYIQSH